MDDGWHILKCLDIKEPYTPALDEIRPSLRNNSASRKPKPTARPIWRRLLQQNPIAVNELALSKGAQQVARHTERSPEALESAGGRGVQRDPLF